MVGLISSRNPVLAYYLCIQDHSHEKSPVFFFYHFCDCIPVIRRYFREICRTLAACPLTYRNSNQCLLYPLSWQPWSSVNRMAASVKTFSLVCGVSMYQPYKLCSPILIGDFLPGNNYSAKHFRIITHHDRNCCSLQSGG